MKAYHDLLRRVLKNGVRKPTRAKVDGRNVDAISVFGEQIRVDLREGFPLITTKRVHFDSIFHELRWFLTGDTDIEYLREKNVSIWDEWADDEGRVGRMYGAQWRSFGEGAFCVGVDQIENLISDIKCVRDDPYHPAARRMIVTAWHPVDAVESALPPCHILFQLHLSGDNRLSCHVYQRSADLFLGVPFNIASYAILTHLLANRSGVDVGELIFSYGDVHIYTNHLEQVEIMLSREPRPLPTLTIKPSVSELDDLGRVTRSDVLLVGYDPYPAIKGDVAV